MDSLRPQHGYDVAFISEVPDYLHCIVCRLVLRDPVMVMACGHKFCQTCFACLKQYAQTMKVELRCPVDMNVVDSTKVCEDFGLQRAIGCLLVQCGKSSTGCSWEGELSELPTHEKKCFHSGVKTSGNAELLAIVKDLQTRVNVCEESLVEKDAEIAALKRVTEDAITEMTLLKQGNAKMLHEIKLLSENFMEMVADISNMKEHHNEERRKLNETITKMNEYADQVKAEGEANHQVGLINRHEVLRMVQTKLAEVIDSQMQGNSSSLYSSLLAYPSNRSVLQHYIGDPKNTTITPNNDVTFHNNWSTVALLDTGTTQHSNTYYEVTFHGKVDKRTSASSYVGWATSRFQPCQKREYRFVGDSVNSWGFSGQERYKHHQNKYTRWGAKFKCNGDHVLGVALDTNNRQLLYSFNGSWQKPMGMAFGGLAPDLELFPAITGYNIKLSVNFGATSFKYYPPDPSYVDNTSSSLLQ